MVTEKDRRHSSVSDAPMSDSNVLRKVASLTLDKLTESRVVRPKFVPDKLDFKLYEKFEGNLVSYYNPFTTCNHVEGACPFILLITEFLFMVEEMLGSYLI